MKPVFYYFGVGRQKNLFSVADPIRISRTGGVAAIDSFTRNSEARLLNQKLLQNYRFQRGLLFGATTNKNLVKFLKLGKMLAPNIQKDRLSIFLLPEKKLILFKVNCELITWKSAKSQIWKIIRPLKLMSLKAFRDKTRGIKDDEYSCECNVASFSYKEYIFSLCASSKLYFTIKTNRYYSIKKKIMRIYKNK